MCRHLTAEDLAWAQMERHFRKLFCFSVKLIWATIEHLFMVLGQIKTCTFFKIKLLLSRVHPAKCY